MNRRIILIALFSCAVLASEIAITRIFSVIFWYHYGFLILSTSMLGFGLAGVLMRIFRTSIQRAEPDRLIALGVSTSGLALAVAMGIITHHPLEPLVITENFSEAAKLILASVALVIPFVFMGMTTLYMLQRWPGDVRRLYGANLLGSGLGCLVAIGLLDLGGGLSTFILLSAALPLLGFWYGWPMARKISLASLLLALLLLAALPLQKSVYPLKSPLSKPSAYAGGEENLVYTEWTSLSKVDIIENYIWHNYGVGLWGLSSKYSRPHPERLAVLIDYWAYTTIIKDKPDAGYYDFLDYLPAYLVYTLFDTPSVLIIGSGGGMDIRGALRNRASYVDAVEINPGIFEALHGPLAAYSGNVYTQPNVHGHLAEGRRFVESCNRKYDIVQLSGVDTYSATQAGAFALSENFLYTGEAIQSYFEHLNPEGVLTLTRWYWPSKDGTPRFSMRLFTLAVDALTKLGVKDPAKHILFVRSGEFTVILIKKTPFKVTQLARIDRQVKNKNYAYLYQAGKDIPAAAPYASYLESKDRKSWLDAYEFNVAAPTDDNPFFFEHRKLKNLYKFQPFLTGWGNGLDGQTILAMLLMEMLLASVILLVLSFRFQKGRPQLGGWLYFLAIGLGFMLVEVTFSQRLVLFLGHPAYALSIVMFTVLVFSGLGSLLVERIRSVVSVPTVLLILVGYLLLWAAFGTPFLRALIAWPAVARMAIAVLLIAPAAVLMGVAFPEAVRRLNNGGEQELGMYWAWNGVGSVTASILAVVVAMGVGFQMVLILAAICYAVAALSLRSFGRN